MSEDITTSPIHVLHVAQLGVVLGKPEWRSYVRQEALRWPDTVTARFDQRPDGTLRLDQTWVERPALERSQVAVITDRVPRPGLDTPYRWFGRGDAPYDLLQLSPRAPASYEIFTIRLGPTGLELWLEYARNSWIGEPALPDMKLANLAPGSAVRVRLAGKNDFSMTGRRARTYRVLDYLIRHLGLHERFALVTGGAAQSNRRVRLEEAKFVDLMKRLY